MKFETDPTSESARLAQLLEKVKSDLDEIERQVAAEKREIFYIRAILVVSLFNTIMLIEKVLF